MFDQYSDRARTIVFVARYRSGKDGAAAIDTDHFIEAIVFVDQGKLAEALDSDRLLSPVYEPTHFFPPDVGSEILLKIQQVFAQREPIPTSVDMPLTADLTRTFAAANTLIAELNHKQVEPLHLLAAALSEQSEAAKLLATFGITRDHVITTLKSASKER